MYTKNTNPNRSLDELKASKYTDLTSAEINRLRLEDPDGYKAAIESVDGPPKTAEELAAAPEPEKKWTVYRNGVAVE